MRQHLDLSQQHPHLPAEAQHKPSITSKMVCVMSTHQNPDLRSCRTCVCVVSSLPFMTPLHQTTRKSLDCRYASGRQLEGHVTILSIVRNGLYSKVPSPECSFQIPEPLNPSISLPSTQVSSVIKTTSL